MTEQQTWVLIRGLMRDKRHWQAFADNLLAAGFRVELIDLPGNGDRVADTSPWDIQDYADFVADELLRRKVGKCRILAISMGAMVAMTLAGKNDTEAGRQKGFQLEGLLLLNSSAADLSPWYQRFRLQACYEPCALESKARAFNGARRRFLRLPALLMPKTSLCAVSGANWRLRPKPHSPMACDKLLPRPAFAPRLSCGCRQPLFMAVMIAWFRPSAAFAWRPNIAKADSFLPLRA